MAALIKKYVGLFLGLFVFVLLVTGLASDWKKSSPVAYQPVIPGYGLQKNGLVIYVDSQLIMTAARASDSIAAMKSSMSALSTTTMSINGSVQSLSADRTWNVGTLVGADTNSMSNRINGKFATPAGNTSQYLRGNGSMATFPTNISSFTNDALYITGINSGMVTTALGFTPYNATNPAGYTSNIGTVTSVGVSSSDLSVAGSPVTSSGNVTVSLNTTGVAAGTYNGNVTVDTKGRITSGSNISFNNTPNRSSFLVTTANSANGFQPSATRASFCSYSIAIQVNASGLVAGASSGYVLYQICPTNSATGADWIEVGRWTNGQTFTSLLTLSSTQPIGSDIMKIIPAGYYVRFLSVNVSGTPSYTYNSGQEINL